MDGLHTTFVHDFEVSPDDIDELGHVNNTVYLRYAEEVARAHSEHRGLSLEAYRACGALPVARRHLITYYLPAVLGDTLRVSTEVEALAGAKAARRTQVRRAADGALLTEVETEWVWINQRGRPTRAPKAVLEAFGLQQGHTSK